MGLLGGVVAIVIVFCAALRVEYDDGRGAAFASISSLQIVAGRLTGFAIGFWLTLRRGRALMRGTIRNA
jgi:hypothetical protein